MQRRDFLIESGRTVLGASLLDLAACSRTERGASTLEDDPGWSSRLADLERRIPPLLERAAVPGLSLALIHDGALRWRRGFGVKDARTREPVDVETVFEVGSVSKTVFAYVVMKLCEKGVLSLDAPLTQYTPERLLPDDPRLDLITARHVLSHTTGLPNWRSSDDPLHLHFTPGTQYSYSGEGYSYLQSVVTRLTGRVEPNDCGTFELSLRVCGTDFDRYMQVNLLQPFGMTSSGYLWNGRWAARVAHAHDVKGTPLDRGRPSPPTVARYGAAGGLLTTPSDYARFVLEVLTPKPADAFRLTQASLREMLRPQVEVPNDPREHARGLGWGIQRRPEGVLILHGGSNPGFQSLVAASPSQHSGLVIVTNGDNGYDVIEDVVASEAVQGLLKMEARVERARANPEP